MSQDLSSNEVARIVHALAAMPGSKAVNITSKRFPRFGPTGPLNMYEERTSSFRPDAVPEMLAVPQGAEEIFITVQGAVPEPTPRSELVDKLNNIFGDTQLSPQWAGRAKFTRCEADGRHYEVTVFSSPAGKSIYS